LQKKPLGCGRADRTEKFGLNALTFL